MSGKQVKHEIVKLQLALNGDSLDTILDCYDENATLVIKPGVIISGKDRLFKAFKDVHTRLGESSTLNRGDNVLIESGDTALLISKTYLTPAAASSEFTDAQRSIHVFKKDNFGNWRCVIDNFFGTDLLDYV